MTGSDDNDITPTKAVAIKGTDTPNTPSDNAPPKIVAKGTGALAERILDIAFAEGIKVRQDKDLTELLDAFDIDSPVPLEALHAVSLVLERVYAENQKLAGNSSASDEVSAGSDTAPRGPATLDGETGEPLPVDDNCTGASKKGST